MFAALESPALKSHAVKRLANVRRYSAKPLRRKYIAKSNGKQRPLGTPVMIDQCFKILRQTSSAIWTLEGDITTFFRQHRIRMDGKAHADGQNEPWSSDRVSAS
jgi:hypothetical protein